MEGTGLAEGPEWEAASEVLAAYMKKMEEHRADVVEELKKKKKKLKNKIKHALHVSSSSSSTANTIPPCKEGDVWRYWLFTHETDTLHKLSDISLVSTLFKDNNSDSDNTEPLQAQLKATAAGASAQNGLVKNPPPPKQQQRPVAALPTTTHQYHRYGRSAGGYTGYKSKTKYRYGGGSFGE